MITFPPAAAFGKKISFAQLRKQGAAPRFARWMKSVVWAYKLAPSTINLSASDAVREIEVLDVVLREACSTPRARALVVELFSALIPNPCILRLYGEAGDELGVAVCPKLSAGGLYGDSPVYRCTLGLGAFEADWGQEAWAGVTSLEAFLIRFTAALAGMQVIPGEALKDFIVRHYTLASLRAAREALEPKIAKERQLDVKYRLVKERQQLEQEIQKCHPLNT
ncbi:MAG: DUF4391 domain-containing protein [Candidatus Spyradenecus sp.]